MSFDPSTPVRENLLVFGKISEATVYADEGIFQDLWF